MCSGTAARTGLFGCTDRERFRKGSVTRTLVEYYVESPIWGLSLHPRRKCHLRNSRKIRRSSLTMRPKSKVGYAFSFLFCCPHNPLFPRRLSMGSLGQGTFVFIFPRNPEMGLLTNECNPHAGCTWGLLSLIKTQPSAKNDLQMTHSVPFPSEQPTTQLCPAPQCPSRHGLNTILSYRNTERLR